MTALQPVSFKKGRKSLPRLSAPYQPGRHSDRYWSEKENNILREHYPSKGFAFCASRLEKRSKTAIYGQVKKLGLKRDTTKVDRVKKHDYAALDADILRIWPEFQKPQGSINGCKALAVHLDKPHWMISDRLKRLGLSYSRKKEPNWTAAEDALMQHVPLHDPDKASEIFKAHGFLRSPIAIVVRCKRLGFSRRYKEALSATAAAKILGIDSKTVSLYCIDGIIKSGRRPTRRLPQQGGDWHTITPQALRQFVIDHVERIDFRRVDKFELVKLLTMSSNPEASA